MITKSYFESSVNIMNQVIDTIFIGKIIKSTKDSLEILRIKDNLFDFLLGKTNDYKTLKFYNDSLITCQETKFKTISISSGLCYGNCPMQAIEIDSSGNLFFFGIAYAFKEGNYKGKLNFQNLDTIKHLLSAAIINRESLKLYSTGIDAPGTEMKIVLENNDTVIIDGESIGSNYRLWQIFSNLTNSIKTSGMVKNTTPHKFLSTKYIEN